MKFTMDPIVFGFFAAVCVGTGLLFGLAPALHVSNTDVHEVMKEPAAAAPPAACAPALVDCAHRRRGRADARAAGGSGIHDAQLSHALRTDIGA